jgi:alanine-synthesizing transaminase
MCLGLLGPGDIAVVGNPSFQIHSYAVVLAGASVVQVPLGDDRAFLDRIERVLEGLTPRPKAVILNYPHNPTGITVDHGFFDDVVRMADRHQVMILHDFAYGETCFDGYRAPSFLEADGAKEFGVEFTTLSKPYNMAGWRVGFCAGNAEMIRALGMIKGYYDYGMFQAIQIAAIVALRETEAAVERQSQLYQKRRDVLVGGLRRLGWEVELPKAGMFVWARVPEPWRSAMSTMDFAMLLLEKGDVAVSPGSGFGPAGEGYLRLALVENDQRLRQAVRHIGRCLDRTEVPPPQADGR